MLRFFRTRDPDPRALLLQLRSAFCQTPVSLVVINLTSLTVYIQRTLRLMPISAQQWRVAVGKMNANKRCPAAEKRQKSGSAAPCEGSPRKPSAREERREYVANLLTVMYAHFLALRSIVLDVFQSERDENEGSTRKIKAKGKDLQGSLVVLLHNLRRHRARGRSGGNTSRIF